LDIRPNERGYIMSDTANTIAMIAEGKTPKLLTLVPKGHSPKLYVDLVKSQIMGVDQKGNARPDDDLLLFLYVAKRTGLDPLTKQIYAIYRWDSRQGKDKMTIQASIDGMRVVAQRTKGYAGQDDVVFDDEKLKQPGKATVTVYKLMGGQRVPFTASARWGEYVQTNSQTKMPILMWEKMPYLMLGKCAEALALRKAFPNELSGIYAPEEMGQTNNVLADLAAPARFEKKEPEVISGAPDEESTKSDINAPTEPLPQPEQEPKGVPKVILGTKDAPDIGAMRAALKPKTIEEIQKAVKDMGKTASKEEPKTQDPSVIGPQ
jgi:phage recombination protein Bet